MFLIITCFNFISISYALPPEWPTDKIVTLPDMGRAPFLKMIGDAKNTLDISAYNISDPALIAALINAANTGVTVRAFTYSTGAFGTSIQELNDNGIQICQLSARFEQAHHNVFIVDDTYAVISTGNWDAPSFDGLSATNTLPSRDFATSFENTGMIQELKNAYENDIIDGSVSLNSKWTQEEFLVWGPKNHVDVINKLIASAAESIDIYLQDFSDKNIAQSLVNASVSLNTRINMTNYPSIRTVDDTDMFDAPNINFYLNTINKIHANIMIIDAGIEGVAKMYLGSSNFSTGSLDENSTNNWEVGIVTSNTSKIQAARDLFDQDFLSQ